MKTLIAIAVLIASTALAAEVPVTLTVLNVTKTVTIPDDAAKQQRFKDWLDLKYDKPNAGTQYVQRLANAIWELGVKGVNTEINRWEHNRRYTAALAALDASEAADAADPVVPEE